MVVVASIGSNLALVNQRHTIEVLVNVVLVVGLYVFVGNSGVLSFGQMSFMSIGAYTTALITIPLIQKGFLLPDLPWLPRQRRALAAPGGAGRRRGRRWCSRLILVVPIVRLSGLAASLAMFAVLVIVYQVAINWDAVTRGSRTMIGVPTNTTIWIALGWARGDDRDGLRCTSAPPPDCDCGPPARTSSPPAPPASTSRASAASPSCSAPSSSGSGGFLYAQFQGAFTPSAFFIHITFLTIAMLVVGGQKSLAGAVIGAVSVSVLSFVFNSIEDGVNAGPIHFAGRDGLSDTALGGVHPVGAGISTGRDHARAGVSMAVAVASRRWGRQGRRRGRGRGAAA